MSYNATKSISRGKIVVSTKDFLPGELILEEEPFAFFPNDSNERTNHLLGCPLSMINVEFNYFMKTFNAEQQAKVLKLYESTPTCSGRLDFMREVMVPFLTYSPNKQTPPRHLTETEIVTLFKVNTVFRKNMFKSAEFCLLYTEINKFPHSCVANCSITIEGRTMRCCAIQSIKQGEEMTISYASDVDIRPTHERRRHYLQYKDFTCHCPRCDAPGDDTRQFDCSDPACKGVMMVCQPLNHELILAFGRTYTGVEYVEPHLLPCTVCHRAPTAAYQDEMFALESQLLITLSYITLIHKYWESEQWSVTTPDFQLWMNNIPTIPRCHQLTIPILDKLMALRMRMLVQSAQDGDKSAVITGMVTALRHVVEEYLTVQDTLFYWPHLNKVATLAHIVTCCIVVPQLMHLPPLFTPTEAKELMQKTLRLYFIFHGRVTRIDQIDTALLKTLETLPPLHFLDLCAFCEESPLRAAITLSRCGRCRQVTYCSVGCQKAHWKLHKKTCKAPV